MGFLKDEPIVIAEIGNNHGGSLGLAKKMVLAALVAGTPYVKFQTMIPDRLLSVDHPALKEFSKEALSFDDFRELKHFCEEQGAVFLSTPFDFDSADLLEELDVPAFKIASGDLTHIPLLEHVAKKQRPILLSTGASTIEDIDAAVNSIMSLSEAELIVMHCTAAYPCPDEEANISVITELSNRYRCKIGFSDHTLGIDIALSSVALGAMVIEKHFTTDKILPGGDNAISILPDELNELCIGARRIYKAIGVPLRQKSETELKIEVQLQRSLVARRDIQAGGKLQIEDVDALRPGGGLKPSILHTLLGRKITKNVKQGEMLTEETLQ